jgi:uncharacterized protein YgbK (DUF1537 family)
MPVYRWYVGHQKTFRPSSSAARTVVVTGSRRRVAARQIDRLRGAAAVRGTPSPINTSCG